MILSPRLVRGNRSILSGILAVAAVLCLAASTASAAPTDAKDNAPVSGQAPAKALNAEQSAVTAIRIEALGSTENAIIGDLSKPTTVTLKKTAPSEYLLSLELSLIHI